MRRDMPKSRPDPKVQAKLRALPNVDLFADRLSSDPRLRLLMVERCASNLRRAPVFRSCRAA